MKYLNTNARIKAVAEYYQTMEVFRAVEGYELAVSPYEPPQLKNVQKCLYSFEFFIRPHLCQAKHFERVIFSSRPAVRAASSSNARSQRLDMETNSPN